MAKKRKEMEPEEDEDIEIELPGFDEREFIKEENIGAKTSYIAIGLGALAGLIDALIIIFTGQWMIGGIVAILIAGAFYPLFRLLKIELNSLKVRNWIGMAIFFLLTTLLINVVLLQPPLVDKAPARIDSNMIIYDDPLDPGNYTVLEDATGLNTLYFSNDVNYTENATFTTRVRDNVGISTPQIFVYQLNTGTNEYNELFSADMEKFYPSDYLFSNATWDEYENVWEDFEGTYFEYHIPRDVTTTRGDYQVRVRVEDDSGKVTWSEYDFKVRPAVV